MQANEVTAGRFLIAVVMAGLAFSSASFVLAGSGVAATEATERASNASPGEKEETVAGTGSAGEERQVVLYYFHGARRCKTCLTIEANAREVVESVFASELKSGTLAWRVVNYDEPENEHFINDLGLTSSSLVLVETSGGDRVRFDVLQDAWSLVRDKSKFDDYVRESILGYLG
jgi:hypothetical protein